jgi:hypothetical protein
MLLKLGTYQLSRGPDRSNGQPSDNPSWIQNLRSRFWQGLKGIAAFLSQPEELQIRQRHTRSGELVWDVYDPQAGRSASFTTEEELMAWLDNRYNSTLSYEDRARNLALTYPLATFR